MGQLRQALAAGLGGHTALQKLMLYENRIGDGGIKAWHGASCARMVCWKVGAASQFTWIVGVFLWKEGKSMQRMLLAAWARGARPWPARCGHMRSSAT